MKLFYCKIEDMEEWLKGQSHCGYSRTIEDGRKWIVNINGVLVGMTNRGFRAMCSANPYYFIKYKVDEEEKWVVYVYDRAVEDLCDTISFLLSMHLKKGVEISEVEMITKGIYYSLLTEEIATITKTPKPCTY